MLPLSTLTCRLEFKQSPAGLHIDLGLVVALLVCAGILATAVMAVNVVVNYQQKLADFLADLASESGQQAGIVHKVE